MSEIVIKDTQGTAQYYIENLVNGIELEMILIPAGTFTMGAPKDEEGSRDNERPQHLVIVPTFFMGKYPITQAQWRAVTNLPQVKRELKLKPSYFKSDDLPVESISWYDAVEFCQRLSKHTGRNYRLPSEAEWEYACRAGTTTPFHFGETITTDLANYRGTDNEEYKWFGSYGQGTKGIYFEKTTPVGSFDAANAFGLYDMHGNILEWCLDSWHDDYQDAPTDGSAWIESENQDNNNRYQVLRGGSWPYHPEFCRSAYRYCYKAERNGNSFGFRVACGIAPEIN
ncbi:hypothetical protein Riv7116_6109 [Rivularia sp. PCC 7116]|uniref:formylglycine-generating enzyme family protein n=1 Tax=Rivularia sp. PCC 7116 TaxID=373994 RepID=UPI00029ED1CE|nr:formylglycine-generating enzyme family protein [Rivularia sp. PCC 7116]AFY58465.1 hypothetical protein Riv7116_6109 [Rivularia sp. PCC 7116]